MTAIDRIRSAVQPIVDELGVELYDLELNGAALRITLDQPGGISLDTLAEVTRQISGELDLLDPIDSRYTLEVTSPGLERTLRTPEHFRRAVGEQVKVKLRVEIDGDRRVEGTLSAATDETVAIAVDGRDDDLVVEFAAIDKARTAFEWGPTPKQGGNETGSEAGQTIRRTRS